MMHEDPAALARRDALNHAMVVLGMAANLRNAGNDANVVLRSAREQIDERGVPGAPGSPEHVAGTAEREQILRDVDSALAGANQSSGLDPLTSVEGIIQKRLAKLLF